VRRSPPQHHSSHRIPDRLTTLPSGLKQTHAITSSPARPSLPVSHQPRDQENHSRPAASTCHRHYRPTIASFPAHHRSGRTLVARTCPALRRLTAWSLQAALIRIGAHARPTGRHCAATIDQNTALVPPLITSSAPLPFSVSFNPRPSTWSCHVAFSRIVCHLTFETSSPASPLSYRCRRRP